MFLGEIFQALTAFGFGTERSFSGSKLDLWQASNRSVILPNDQRQKNVAAKALLMRTPQRAREVGIGILYGTQVLLFGHLFITYGYSTAPAFGVSMVPTIYSSGEFLVTSKKYRRGRGVQVGDLVSFKNPVMTELQERAVKRVIGMPGDFVLRDTPGAGIYGQEAMLQVCRTEIDIVDPDRKGRC